MILPTRCNENARQHLKVMGDLGQIVQMDYSIRDRDRVKYAAGPEHSSPLHLNLSRFVELWSSVTESNHHTHPSKGAQVELQPGGVCGPASKEKLRVSHSRPTTFTTTLLRSTAY